MDDDILKIGKYEFDVSRISQTKIETASKMYNEAHGYKCNHDGSVKTDKNGQAIFNPQNVTVKQIIKIALFMLRQEFCVLRRKNLPFLSALKEYIKRYLVSIRYIKSLSTEEVDNIVDWVRFKLTGKKKATQNILTAVNNYLNEMTEGMTEEQVKVFEKSLLNSLSSVIGNLNILKPTVKKK